MSAESKELRPLGARTVHVAVDMQRVFAEATAWHIPSLLKVLGPIQALTEAHAGQTIFTRFLTPRDADDAKGSWRAYYQRWRTVLLNSMDASMLDLVEPLARYVPPAEICDKTTFSAFHSDAFAASLARRQADTLVLTGAETDVCVLATALDAVDHGYRVIVGADAVTSLSSAGHRATLAAVFARLEQQIEVAAAADVLAAWRKG
jgi:nicotinamidase-related amidase